MALRKPRAIKDDIRRNSLWNEIVRGRKLPPAAASTVSMLVEWKLVAQSAVAEMDEAGGMTAYQDEMGNLKALPQISTLKAASAEIRQLERMLDEMDTGGEEPERKQETSVLTLVANNRAQRRSRASG